MSPPVDIKENAPRAKESDFEEQKLKSFYAKLLSAVCKRFLASARQFGTTMSCSQAPPFSGSFRETISYFLLRVGSSTDYAVSSLELVPPTTQRIVPELPLYTVYREGLTAPLSSLRSSILVFLRQKNKAGAFALPLPLDR
jgi:hypothetical protein